MGLGVLQFLRYNFTASLKQEYPHFLIFEQDNSKTTVSSQHSLYFTGRATGPRPWCLVYAEETPTVGSGLINDLRCDGASSGHFDDLAVTCVVRKISHHASQRCFRHRKGGTDMSVIGEAHSQDGVAVSSAEFHHPHVICATCQRQNKEKRPLSCTLFRNGGKNSLIPTGAARRDGIVARGVIYELG